MNKLLRLILLLAVVGLGVWLWLICFPNPKQVIHKRLTRLAELASFSPNEGNVRVAFDVERFADYFAPDVQIVMDIPGYDPGAINSRADLMSLVAGIAKSMKRSIQAEFLDMDIELGTGAQSALVDLTLKAHIAGDSDIIVQEMKFTMKKVDGSWLITRIETVRPLKP